VKQVLVRGGGVAVEDVPAPALGRRELLVRVEVSCVSVGTEISGVQMSGLPLYRRALKQPHHAKKALELARDQGFVRVYKRVRGQLAAGLPTGYSAAGTVVAVGDEVAGFSVGDRVACAGAGVANHAEFIAVPVNLAARVPDGVPLADASTVTLGAIALQGVRRAEPTLGETVAVLGLGILGQLTVQLLLANGCRVVGSDLDEGRIETALASGMTHAVRPGESFAERVLAHTDGVGADAVVVTAATPSDAVVSQAFQACRKRGRVVVVGDVGLGLKRHDMYAKELDLRMSTSYGPGRYDEDYEVLGQDYPIGFVRWTENRNMAAYLELLGAGRVDLAPLSRAAYPVDAAGAAYAALQGEGEKPLLVLLEYASPAAEPGRVVRLRTATRSADRIGVALVGAGSFAQGTHVPNLLKLRDAFTVQAVVSRTGTAAKAVAAQTEAAYATTELDAVLADDAVDLVLISTRHDLHAEQTLRALAAGKHVFVEKPLALSAEELDRIEAFYADATTAPLLLTGFNRRFSPAIEHVRTALAERASPLVVDYRMNAGYIPLDSWVHGPEGGGRNIGEACHVYDVFDALTGASTTSVSATAIRPTSARFARNDNFAATIAYEDGSVCTLTYTALGSREHPKERLEAFADGAVVSLDDYRSVTVAGRRGGWSSRTVDKGHLQELEALARGIREGEWPISLEQQLQAMRIAFAVEDQLSQ
jgi:predicted dehydrogenase/threonine dehydrogenase-like Zn-dependent dehydrogenase